MRLLALLFVPLLALLVAGIFAFVQGFILMLLWNWLLVGATSIIGVSLPAITWLQGWGVAFFGSMVFKGSSSSSNSSS